PPPPPPPPLFFLNYTPTTDIYTSLLLVTFFHLFVNDLSSALMVRAAHGMVAAALSSLGIYYQIQALSLIHIS
ncbi:hypothetical protein DXF97_44760, partial [Klebsiella pneumoniae]